MYRIILFLLLIALAAAGAAWVADQTGDVVLSWGGVKVVTTLPVFALALAVTVVAAMLAWSVLRALWRTPGKIRRVRRERRHARGRHAITHGLLAIGHGDSAAARAHADVARRHAADDPLALLLHAQSAQLDGDRVGAQRAFRAMAERKAEADPAEVGLDPARLDRIDRHFRRYVDDGRLPGWLITVSRHGRLAHPANMGLPAVLGQVIQPPRATALGRRRRLRGEQAAPLQPLERRVESAGARLVDAQRGGREPPLEVVAGRRMGEDQAEQHVLETGQPRSWHGR